MSLNHLYLRSSPLKIVIALRGGMANHYAKHLSILSLISSAAHRCEGLMPNAFGPIQ
jgi:hypothetical protein